MRNLFIVVTLLFASLAFGQAGRYDNIAYVNISGTIRPVAGAVITVCTSSGTGTPCLPKATIYTDVTAISPAANPFTADSNGNFGFWALPGTYVVTITGSSATPYTLNVVIPVVSNSPVVFTSVNSIQMVPAESLATAITNCGSSLCTVDVTGTATISADTTVPATATLAFDGGKITGSHTLTVNGDVVAPDDTQIFDASVTVAGLLYSRPEWFGVTTLSQAVNALASTGGTVLLRKATYQSDYCGTGCQQQFMTKANVDFLGSGWAQYAADSTHFTSGTGTIIQGFINLDADNTVVRNISFDNGSAYVNASAWSGLTSYTVGQRVSYTNGNGTATYTCIQANTNQQPDTQTAFWTPTGDALSMGTGNPTPLNGIIQDTVNCLTGSGTAGQMHCDIAQNVSNAIINNVVTRYGAHGLVLKGTGTISNTLHQGHDADSLIVKSNSYAGANYVTISDVRMLNLASAGDTAGMSVDAQDANLDKVTIKGVVGQGLKTYCLIADGETTFIVSNLVASDFLCNGTGSSGTDAGIVITGLVQRSTFSNFTIENFPYGVNMTNAVDTGGTPTRDLGFNRLTVSNTAHNSLLTRGINTVVTDSTIYTGGSYAIEALSGSTYYGNVKGAGATSDPGASITPLTIDNAGNFSVPGNVFLSGDLQLLNKAGTAYLEFAQRNTAGSEAVYNVLNSVFDTAGSGNTFKVNGNTVNGVTGTGSTAVLSVAPTITGHPTIEGVTSTGATGTGSFVFGTSPSVTGLTSDIYKTASNCSSSAAPAVCGSASAGNVVVAASASTVVVNTTAVTANSEIFLTRDDSLGTRLSVTCNTATAAGDIKVSARTAATSFTITVQNAPVTNPLCLSYRIVN